MPRLVRPRRVRVIVLVLELVLQFALFLGRLPSVLRRRGWVEIDLLIHRRSPQLLQCF